MMKILIILLVLILCLTNIGAAQMDIKEMNNREIYQTDPAPATVTDLGITGNQ